MPISEIFTLFKRCNKYIDETMPWALAKDEAKADRLSTVLYNLVESITIGAALLMPFMPDTAEKIVAQLGTTLRAYDTLDTFGVYPNGGKVTDKPEILFARIDPKEMGEKIAAVEAKYAPKEEPKKEIEGLAQINIEDFAKVELRSRKGRCLRADQACKEALEAHARRRHLPHPARSRPASRSGISRKTSSVTPSSSSRT